MTAHMSVLRKPSQGQTSIIVSLLCLIAGFCLTAAGLAVAVEYSRAEIHLHREAGTVSGSVRWVLAGIPIFWRSLNGLAQVDRGDYQVRDDGNGGPNRPLKNVARVVFRDHAGNRLAWAERTAIVNEVEPLQRFLRQETTGIEANRTGESVTSFKFVEVPRGTTWDRIQAGMLATVFVTILALAGILCVLAGILSLYRRVAAIAV